MTTIDTEPIILRGWGEIADFLRISQSAARRRWKDGMPVMKDGEGRNAPVCAFREELLEWYRRRGKRRKAKQNNVK